MQHTGHCFGSCSLHALCTIFCIHAVYVTFYVLYLEDTCDVTAHVTVMKDHSEDMQLRDNRMHGSCMCSMIPSNICAVYPAGGTRFIGLYLARQLVEQGHDVTLFTRGKKSVTSEIPDDTPSSYARYKSRVKHIAGDRMVSGGDWLWGVEETYSLPVLPCTCPCVHASSVVAARGSANSRGCNV